MATQTDKNSKQVIFENYAPFTDRFSETNNTQVDYGKHLDVVMPICNLLEYSDNSKTCRAYGNMVEINQMLM